MAKCARFAAIDIGTGCILLTLVEKELGAPLRILENACRTTRLGFQVEQTGRLDAEAIKRSLECLLSYREKLASYRPYQIRAVGTSALRDADGSDFFRQQAEQILSCPVEIISGKREAELTFKGAISDLPDLREVFAFDIGGGSTELVWGHAPTNKISKSVSLQMGSVRLTERHRLHDDIHKEHLDAAQDEVREILKPQMEALDTSTTAIGIAGTVTSLHRLSTFYAQAMCVKGCGTQRQRREISSDDGQTIHHNDLMHFYSHLVSLSATERRQLPGLDPGRADVIVCGALILSEIIALSGCKQVLVSDRGVRFGLLQEELESSGIFAEKP